MLKVQNNSRQVPSVKTYTADKQYCDLLYGYLQEQSYGEFLDGKIVRYVDKKVVNFSALVEIFGKEMSRQTLSNKFKYLINLGFVEYIEDEKRYKLNYLDKDIASLIPYETLKYINCTLSYNSINIFVYLLNRFIANGEKPFIATIDQMKDFIGFSKKTRSNNYIIYNILIALTNLNLIEYELQPIDVEKTVLMFKKVSNEMSESDKKKANELYNVR